MASTIIQQRIENWLQRIKSGNGRRLDDVFFTQVGESETQVRSVNVGRSENSQTKAMKTFSHTVALPMPAKTHFSIVIWKNLKCQSSNSSMLMPPQSTAVGSTISSTVFNHFHMSNIQVIVSQLNTNQCVSFYTFLRFLTRLTEHVEKRFTAYFQISLHCFSMDGLRVLHIF